MAEVAIACPLAVFDAHHQFRLGPAGDGFEFGRVPKRRLGNFDATQTLVDDAQRFLRETRADAPDVAQRFAVVQAHQQGAEMFAGVLRSGPAADDGVELSHDLQLQPIARAFAGVSAVNLLGDDAFETAFARQGIKLATLFNLMIGKANEARSVQQIRKKGLALEQRNVA